MFPMVFYIHELSAGKYRSVPPFFALTVNVNWIDSKPK